VVLLVKASRREGKAVGSEEGKAVGSVLSCGCAAEDAD
jgi:hypothetical protein